MRGRPPAHAKLVDFALLGILGLLVLLVIGLSAFAGFFRDPIDDVQARVDSRLRIRAKPAATCTMACSFRPWW